VPDVVEINVIEVNPMRNVRILKTGWLLLLAGLLVAGHAIALYRVSSHVALTVGLGLVLLVLFKHLGLLGAIYAFFKRRSRDLP
jgi:hypothetical protein